MSDDTPTQRFDAPLTPTTPPEPEDEKKSRGLLIALIVIGALLLIGIIVVLILLLGGKSTPTADVTTASASASASDTPSATPIPSPSATPAPTKPATTVPAPPSNAPTISSFTTASATVYCNTSAPTGDHQPISFSWSSSNVTQVYFGVDTSDASTGALFSGLPPSGNSNDDFPPGSDKGSYEYPCTAPSTVFTLTVVNGSGQKVSKSVTIVNKGDK